MLRISKSHNERRLELINASERLFFRCGFEETTVSDIVKEVHVTPGTFYCYFKSKDDVLAIVILRCVSRTIEKYRAIINQPQKGAVERISKLLDAAMQGAFSKRDKLFGYLRKENHAGVLQRLNDEVIFQVTPMMEEIIKEGNRNGECNVKNPAEMAWLLAGVFWHDPFPDEPKAREQMKSTLTQLITRSLGTTNNGSEKEAKKARAYFFETVNLRHIVTDTHSSRTQEMILDAASRLFAEQGVFSTSIRHIARLAGVNLAAVNYHFGGKEALALAVYRRCLAPLGRTCLRRLDQLERESAGGHIHLEEVLSAGFNPIASLYLKADGLIQLKLFFQVMSSCLLAPNGRFQAALLPYCDKVYSRFLQSIQHALPYLTADAICWRMDFCIGALNQALNNWTAAEADPNAAVGLREERCIPNLELLIEQLIGFCSEGLRLPPLATPRFSPCRPVPLPPGEPSPKQPTGHRPDNNLIS